MKIFDFRNRLIDDYSTYVKSFIEISDPRIRGYVDEMLDDGHLWPEPLIQMNPSFEPGAWIDDLVGEGTLHPEAARVFRKAKADDEPEGQPLRLHKHQADAVYAARKASSYVLTTGTGSGKSLSYIVPIVDSVLRRGSGKGIQAIIVYPMNALANSQAGELAKFLTKGYPKGLPPVRFARYTGQEKDEEKQAIIGNPPDILLTNYVMLELILTRTAERGLVDAARGLQFLVLDELHTYRGRQGADVAFLVRRLRDRVDSPGLQCVGTSATLASAGTQHQQRDEVARMASLLFGTPIDASNIIGETLRRATPPRAVSDPAFISALRDRVADASRTPPQTFAAFVEDPLSIWLESTFGVTTEGASGQLVRVKHPRSIGGVGGAAAQLAQLTSLDEQLCADAIKAGLLAGYAVEHPDTGFPAFAFRLHQFISRGDTVYASVEDQRVRHITVFGQQFVPDSKRTRALLPLVFCRECGQEYYCVRERRDQSGVATYEGRDIGDRLDDETSAAGFLYANADEPWPATEDEAIRRDKIPEDWIEEKKGQRRIKRDRRDDLPRPVSVTPAAAAGEDGIRMHFVAAPFRFCLFCGVAYGGRQSSDFAKLGSLGSEGRSTATTILSLSAVRHLRGEDLPPHARKLLSFTDNRQDASLQAGHFNDFVEVGILRSALYSAAKAAGADGLTHEQLTQKVFEALSLPLELYAVNPDVRFQALADTQRALRHVIGYRLYRDLERGWRITSPNLEQSGLLRIEYNSLADLAQAEDIWQTSHPALSMASPRVRTEIAKTLLDFMRRELAIKVDYLDSYFQETIQQLSTQWLKAPWALDENEFDAMERAKTLFPRSKGKSDDPAAAFLSARGGFGQYLRRASTYDDGAARPINVRETEIVIKDLLTALRQAGLVEVVLEPRKVEEVPGYQLPASAIRWVAGDGTRGFHDPIRVPKAPEGGRRTNAFFRAFYETIANDGRGLEAREHTAQVPSDTREKRERAFREGTLPILYCSPTMELGVDISELNVVSLRNIPPTPANYAQRSGRAGRSGQPALVFSYCAFGSPHDQYFFRRPELMVAGAVTPPRLDLANEDLVRAHVNAVWLAETGASLGKSLQTILDVAGEEPSLALLDGMRADLSAAGARERAKHRAESILASITDELARSGWYSPEWLDRTLEHALREFDAACERWRTLYRAALEQAKVQAKVVRDATRPEEDKRQAKRLRAEAEAQLHLLTKVEEIAQSDFFSYRYFASEGFLPGYSFPRLPLSAFIPGRKAKQDDEFLSRPRFLAISEFGPRAIIYHEGSRYIINKVILPVGEEQELEERSAKICGTCGYLHAVGNSGAADVCEHCHAALDAPWHNLLRLQNVSTKRREKINSDEEERLRLGYELRTTLRFSDHGGGANRVATVERNGQPAFLLAYGQAATLWRINLGWNRRRDKDVRGFILDKERGYWAKHEILEEAEQDDPMSPQKTRVTPFVEDHRNSLLIKPAAALDERVVASLQASLKNALQVYFQLEEMELAAEPLPTAADRRQILIYESAEGGAGVLRRLIDDPSALASVARTALEICHFTADGHDRQKAPRSQDRCEAACYDCLLSYSNQPDHRRLDRFSIRDILLALTTSVVNSSPVRASRAEHLEKLIRLAGSTLERDWLQHLEQRRHKLPSDAQRLLEVFGTRPDFAYSDEQTVVYIDGPHHLFPERRERDLTVTERLEDAGYTVIRFAALDDWDVTLARYPEVFGKPARSRESNT